MVAVTGKLWIDMRVQPICASNVLFLLRHPSQHFEHLLDLMQVLLVLVTQR